MLHIPRHVPHFNKHEAHTGSIVGVKIQQCVKNYKGSSKSMEAAALIKMLVWMPEEKGVSICCMISDNDSVGERGQGN